jgi:peptidyl-tRNA hydrolase, PTH1 family
METLILVGLGNPGNEYRKTRHNVGIMAVREWANQKEWKLKKDWEAEVIELIVAEKKVVALFPVTLMNASGRAIARVANYYGVSEEKIIVVHDDMEVGLGAVMVAQGGSAKGHNGVRSVTQSLGNDNFWRVKIGIGRPDVGVEPKEFVLTGFKENEQPSIEKAVVEIQNLIEKL